MEKVDVLVIGGSAAGLVAASTGKSYYPDKEFLVIRKESRAMVPCGIPYIFGALGTSDNNILPDALATNAGVKLKIDEVVSIDCDKKLCRTKEGTIFLFEKLIIATGSIPVVPNWLKGIELDNVFTIPKVKTYLDEMLVKLKDCKRIVVIGAGFIGVEVSDELNKVGKDVILVEMLPHILSLVFDNVLAVEAEEILRSRGVEIKTGVKVKEILGDNKVVGVLLDNDERIESDAVILSMGYCPNIALAKEAGIRINEKGFIKVDEYMRTEDADIFAIGDCAEKRDFISGMLSSIMLASTACAEARIAGMNLYKISTLKTFKGTIGIFSTAIGGTALGSAGLTKSIAEREGFDIVTGIFTGIDRHPGNFHDTHKQMVKLIVSRECGVIIGGQVIGGLSAGELINSIGLIIQNRMTINSILTAQIGTHPLMTASPAGYPLIKTAEVVVKNM